MMVDPVKKVMLMGNSRTCKSVGCRYAAVNHAQDRTCISIGEVKSRRMVNISFPRYYLEILYATSGGQLSPCLFTWCWRPDELLKAQQVY